MKSEREANAVPVPEPVPGPAREPAGVQPVAPSAKPYSEQHPESATGGDGSTGPVVYGHGGKQVDAKGDPVSKPARPEPLAQPEPPTTPPLSPVQTSNLMKAASESIKRIFAPQTRGPDAAKVANILREHGGTLQRRSDIATKALEGARAVLGQMPEADRWSFVDRIERGGRQDTPELQTMADTFRSMLDAKREEVRGLGKGKLEHFIEDYFPHLWEDPEKAAMALRDAAAKAPMQGKKSFLKQRTIPTIAEGLALGLKPVSSNPVDLMLLKMREMDKYILGQRVMADLKGRGLVKYVRATERAEEVAPGYARINDSIAQVYGPPTVEVPEFFDKAVFDGLKKSLDALGVKHVREASTAAMAGRKSMGYSIQGGNEIHTRGGTELGVVAHELAHQLDDKFGLGRIINAPDLIAETNALAEEHGEKLADYFRKPEERVADALEAFVQAKERMQEIAPKTYEALRKFLGQHEETAHLVDLKPGVEYKQESYEKPHGGLLKMGEYMAPEPVANVLNNYLSPGLRGNALFDAYNTVANSMNQFQLGFSAFHLGFTSFDAVVSRFAVGIENIVAGRPIKGLGQIATSSIAPVMNAIQGNKVLKEWYQPGSQGEEIGKIVDGMVAAGGRAQMDAFYKTNITKRMVEQWNSSGPMGKIFATLRLPFAGVEQLSRPIMEGIVPRQKLGVFTDMARKALADLPPNATRDQVRATMAKAWDSVDNRMGQLVYDNLFWKKTAKDLGMATVRSLGWNLGTLRELGGGGADFLTAGMHLATGKRAEFTHRMAYAVALPAVTGMIGGMVHYLYNGTAPDDLRDWFFPRTGEKDAQGRDIRISLPTYMKDVAHYWHDPMGTLRGKFHPLPTAIWDMLNNKDYFGQEIRHGDDPLVKQVWDVTKHLASSWEPMAIKNFMQSHASGQSWTKQAANFFGVTQAAKYISMSSSEQLADKLSRDKMKGAPPADTALQMRVNDARLRLRSKDQTIQDQAKADLAKMVGEGVIDHARMVSTIKHGGKDFLLNAVEHLDPREALRVYRQATQAEAAELRPVLDLKIHRSHMAPAEKATLIKALESLSGGSLPPPASPTEPPRRLR
jgi:hypothetical protein